MLSVIYAECQKQPLYAEYHYAEYRYVECRYAECGGAIFEANPWNIFYIVILALM
jgi:hypothetical protein